MPVKVFQNMSLSEEMISGNGVRNPIITAISTAANGIRENVHDEPQVTRELTQTDRINKHLLKSLLDRINATGQMMGHFSTQSSQTTSAADESDDFEEQLYIGTQIM